MKWLIEPEVFQDESDLFIDALKSLGVEYDLCESDTQYEHFISKYLQDKDVLFHGSLQFGKLLKSRNSLVKVFCDLPQYECTYYYPRFGDYLLNSEYVIIAYGDLDRRKDWLINHVGQGSSVFLRPSSGYKSFTGMTVSAKNWNILSFLRNRLDPEDLIVVAPSIEISKEWRVIILEGKIVGASQYKSNFELVRVPGAPKSVLDYAENVLDSIYYDPDGGWTLDICETGSGQLKVVEANSFSCAGFYAADPYPIIKASLNL